MASAGWDSEAPQLTIEIRHERNHAGLDGTEVVVIELLMLGRGTTEQGAPGLDQVEPLFIEITVDQEVLLLGTQRRHSTLVFGVDAKEGAEAQNLRVQGFH